MDLESARIQLPDWIKSQKVRSKEQLNCFLKKAYGIWTFTCSFHANMTWEDVIQRLPEPGRSYLVENIDVLLRLTDEDIKIHLNCSEERLLLQRAMSHQTRYVSQRQPTVHEDEEAKRSYTCSNCGEQGHNIRTCIHQTQWRY